MRTHSGIISSSERSLLPQFLSAVTFEFQRLTEDGTTVDPSDGLRHGNVRIGEPREPVLRFSSRLLLVRNPDYTGISSLGVGLGFRRDRRESPQVLQVYFAAVRNSLVVAAPGHCSSAIKPKVDHLSLRALRRGHDDDAQVGSWFEGGNHLLQVQRRSQTSRSASTWLSFQHCRVGFTTTRSEPWLRSCWR